MNKVQETAGVFHNSLVLKSNFNIWSYGNIPPHAAHYSCFTSKPMCSGFLTSCGHFAIRCRRLTLIKLQRIGLQLN